MRSPHPDFCESMFTESRDREWDFSGKFLRVENENESSGGKIESREWEWEFWGKNRVDIWYETLESSRMRVWLRLRVHCSMTFSIEILMIEASKLNEMLENLPQKCTKFVLDLYIWTLIFSRVWEWELRMRMRVLTIKLRVEIENEMRVFLETLDFEIEMRVSQKSVIICYQEMPGLSY